VPILGLSFLIGPIQIVLEFLQDTRFLHSVIVELSEQHLLGEFLSLILLVPFDLFGFEQLVAQQVAHLFLHRLLGQLLSFLDPSNSLLDSLGVGVFFAHLDESLPIQLECLDVAFIELEGLHSVVVDLPPILRLVVAFGSIEK